MFSIITRHRWFLILLLFVGAIALASCNPTKLKTKAAQVPQLIDHVVGEPKTFNPVVSQESPNVFSLIYEGLIAENGVTGQLEPDLAESWKISDDKKQIVFTLREGLKWSDGKPLTADDVVFTYNDVYLNDRIPTDARDVLRIGKSRALPRVRKLDDRHVEFTVPEPFAPFLRTAGGLNILPKHALFESITTNDRDGKPQFLSKWGTDTDPRQIVCSGPYKLESYTTSQRVVFRRNPYYWRKDDHSKPQPYIDRLIWEIVENTDTALLQFRSGGLDVLEPIPAMNFALLKREEKRGKFILKNGGPETSKAFISFNLNKGRKLDGRPLVDPVKSRWFNTVAFRQAIAYAVDRQTMLDNVYRGLGELQNSPIAVQSPYYLSPKEGLKAYEYSPEKSKELLLGAGFKYNNAGQLLDADSNLVRFTLLSNTGSPTADGVGSQIKRDLGKIGIQADYNPVVFNTLLEKLNVALDWECYFGVIGGGVEPNSGANVWSPNGGLHVFNQRPRPGQSPILGREIADWEEKIGQLYIQAAQELDESKRKALYAETQRLSQEYLPYIYLVNRLSLAAVRDRIQGLKYSALGGALWNIYELKAVEN